MNCPYNILTQFDDWWSWHADVMFHGLTPAQAEQNISFHKAGWVLLKGVRYGGWSPGPTLRKRLYPGCLIQDEAAHKEILKFCLTPSFHRA
jgi:hypothetical protein